MFKVGDKVVFNEANEDRYAVYDIDPNEPMKIIEIYENRINSRFSELKVQYKYVSSGNIDTSIWYKSLFSKYEESTKHPHYDLIVKWAENPNKYKILSKNKNETDWYTHLTGIGVSPSWHPQFEYKLEQIPQITRYNWVFKNSEGFLFLNHKIMTESEAMA